MRLQKLETFIFIESPQDCTILKHLQSLTSLTIAAENSRACSKIPNLKELTVEKRPAASHLCKVIYFDFIPQRFSSLESLTRNALNCIRYTVLVILLVSILFGL